MTLRSSFCGVLMAIVGIAGCSHGAVRELPTAPSPPPITIQRLTITKIGGTLNIGNEVTVTSSGPVTSSGFGAIGLYSDGSAKWVDAAWTSSNEAVVRIEGGRFRALSAGTAELTARAEGMTATETFTVDAGIPGSWAGTFVVNACQAGSGSMGEVVCGAEGRPGGVFRSGATHAVAMTITRGSGDALNATVQVGEVRGTLTGTDRGVNFFTLRGDLTSNGSTLTFVHWDARAQGGVLEGFVGFEVRIAGIPSHAIVTGRFENVTRR